MIDTGGYLFQRADLYGITVASVPDIVVDTATTTDSSTVTATYDIAGIAVTQPLTFNIYRSASQASYTSADLIGTDTLSASDTKDLSVGHHQVKLNLTSGKLLPDPLHEYVHIVANPGRTVPEANYANDTAYFRIYVLGVVSHGFALPGATTLPAWEVNTARELTIDDYYDAVIQVNWLAASNTAAANEAVAAGDLWYAQVKTRADQLAASHPGNIVDLHLIGHSRGTVVVTEIARDFLGTSDPAISGAYINLTLLDPHPANNFLYEKAFYSAYPLTYPLVVIPYLAFQTKAIDPQIVIPSNVKNINIYYQQSSYLNGFILTNLSEFHLNLWGEGPGDGIIDQSSAPIQWHSLTNVVDTTIGPGGSKIGPIGHSEVPIWYEVHVVDAGKASSLGS
jgi:hypothetical protein